MKSIKIIVVSFILAVLVYAAYVFLQSRNTSLSPIPEDGVKVIQISPNEQ